VASQEEAVATAVAVARAARAAQYANDDDDGGLVFVLATDPNGAMREVDLSSTEECLVDQGAPWWRRRRAESIMMFD
jgi:hypothetical protein